jgi:hypothetical protein
MLSLADAAKEARYGERKAQKILARIQVYFDWLKTQ